MLALVLAFGAAAPLLAQGAGTAAGDQTAPGEVGGGSGANSGTALEPATGLPLDPDSDAPPLSAEEYVGSDQGLQISPDWLRLAARAERVLEVGRASNATLEQLRAELATWRAQFQETQTSGASRIETVKAQITALGPAPTDGSTEAPELALRRSELEGQLSRLDAPRRAAEEAYSRADSLIRSIDTLIRERRASELLQLGPSPLNPVNWTTALREVTTSVSALLRETLAAWNSPEQRRIAWDGLPVTLALLLLAGLIQWRVPRWLGVISRRISAGRSEEFVDALDIVKSVLRLAVLIGSVLAVRAALVRTNMFGFRGSILLDNLTALGLVLAIAAWLAVRTFPRGDNPRGFFRLPEPRMVEGRFNTLLLAGMLWAISVVGSLAQVEAWSDQTRAVLQFPVLLVAGLSLFRLGQLIASRPEAEAEAQPSAGPAEFRHGLTVTIGRVASIAGLAGPVLAAIGYMAAASYVTLPAVLTLGLFALLLLALRLVTDVYGIATGQSGSALDAALVPALLGILLVGAALPVLALVWGARVSDLSEIWLRAREGISLGDTRISPAMFLSFAVVFGIGYGLTRLLQGTLRSTVLPKTRIDPGGQTALVSGLGYLGIFLSALFAITSTGMNLSSLAVVFGALSVGIGFGLQNIVQNFVSGIIMLVERPVAVGDWIEVGGNQGIVKEISVRSTRIETFDRTSVIVPNANFISGTVTNWTRGSLNGRITVPVTVTYAADAGQVQTLLREIVEAHPLVMLNPKPSVTLDNFGASGLEFTVRAILPNINFGGSVRSELRHQILTRFREAGIAMPGFPGPAPLAAVDRLAQALTDAAASGGNAAVGAALVGAAATPGAADPATGTAGAVDADAEAGPDGPKDAVTAALAASDGKGGPLATGGAAERPAARPGHVPGYGPPDDDDDDNRG